MDFQTLLFNGLKDLLALGGTYLLGFEKELNNEIHLGKGFYGYEITLLSGKTIIVEKSSGAIVGNSIEFVKEDILDCEDISFMETQINQACKRQGEIEIINEEEFCKIYR